MAFRMNKPVIQGTKKHSALLKTAEQVRTHGGDPSLVEASALYGASNSPNVIDYKIKQADIKWKKDKKSKKNNEDSTADNKSDTFQLDYKRRKLDRKIGPNKRKKIVAEEDKNKAINTLIANAGADDTEGQDENKQFDSEGNEIITVNSDLDKIVTPKKEDTPREKTEGQYYDPGSLERTDLSSGKNLAIPKSYSNEDLELGRVILTEDGYREAKWWTKDKKMITRKSRGKDDSSPHPDEHLTPSEWLALGQKTYQPKVEEKKVEQQSEEKFKESKEEEKTTKRPREHQYRWGTISTPGGWKSRGKEAYEKALAEWRARNK